MDIDDKLKHLRRERDARQRAQKVERTWEKIDAEGDGLTVKEKLERLISLTGQAGRPGHGPARPQAPAAVAAKRREPVQLHENPYALGVRYGQIPIGMGLQVPGNILAFLSREAAFEGLDLGSAVFLDLETTGLAGGTGTVPFLVGLGYYRGDRFKVSQFFLSEMAEEGRLVREVAQFFTDMEFKSVVTYNGKAFDVPLLETRFALHRTPFLIRDLPHLDFLFSARQLWKHKYDSCRLFNLAQEVVQAERAEDIPGAEIPLRYFQYIRSGDFSLIEPVLYHNQEDILSLLGVVVAGAVLVDRNRTPAERGATDAMDLYGVARLFESAGDAAQAAALLEQALEGQLSSHASQTAKMKLSHHFKKNRDWDRAVSLWRELSAGDEAFSFRELSMYYEHKAKNFEEAMRAAEEGLAVSMGRSAGERKDFEKRIERLRGKIRKREGSVPK
ncbi:MAG TPA: ribonuclease H-like domain-containing protein [Terriglobales bacterium]|nr:ribonuclease H-like domain-containing protein [Terriglobales bacterium]